MCAGLGLAAGVGLGVGAGSLSLSAGVGLLAGLGLGVAAGLALFECTHVEIAIRIVKAQLPVLPADIHAQDFAVSASALIVQPLYRDRLILAVHKGVAGKRRVVVVAAAVVKAPVLARAVAGVVHALGCVVNRAGAFGRHFQRQIGRLAMRVNRIAFVGFDAPHVAVERYD